MHFTLYSCFSSLDLVVALRIPFIPALSCDVFILALRRAVCFVVCFFSIFVVIENMCIVNFMTFEMPPTIIESAFYVSRSCIYLYCMLVCLCGCSVLYLFAMKLFAQAETQQGGWAHLTHTCIHSVAFVFSPSSPFAQSSSSANILCVFFVFVVVAPPQPVGHCSFSISRYKMHAFMSFCSMFYYRQQFVFMVYRYKH